MIRFIVAAAAAGCGGGPPASAPPAPPSTPGPPAAAAADTTPLVVVLGTSLTAGYGLDRPDLAYPAVLQRLIDSAGLALRVVNAGVSGETSAGALRRADWALGRGRVAVLIVETGANDGLRGQDPDSTRANIQRILDRAKALRPPPRVILAGMEAMPNLGRDYTTRFRAIYPDLARANGATLIPFILEGVAGVDSLNQADGIHPTPLGHRLMAATVWRTLREVLRR